jgi:hypothetical protein
MTDLLFEIASFVVQLLGELFFEGLLRWLPDRHGGCGCLIVAALLALLLASIFGLFVMQSDLWRGASWHVRQHFSTA